MGKRSAGKKGKLARRAAYLRSLGINTVRETWCPRCAKRCYLVISPAGSRFWVAQDGSVSCPLR